MIFLLASVTASSLILLVVLIILVPGVAYGLFTVRGSGISETPSDGRDQAPGSAVPSEETGIDRREGSATGSDATGSSDPQHGTK
jgi:hypothetical protein